MSLIDKLKAYLAINVETPTQTQAAKAINASKQMVNQLITRYSLHSQFKLARGRMWEKTCHQEPVTNIVDDLPTIYDTRCPRCGANGIVPDRGISCDELKCFACGYVLATKINNHTA